ncbi:hypothetical protein [Rhizohabitans arisaemae]|uniref:hypothetical protein n=1 Tax=Rhizohabitans arisaemae TaxID=2720610 RepID=UPI0024B0761C|nr:hypothetical protein [Rhizohabitans arisaemae]
MRLSAMWHFNERHELLAEHPHGPDVTVQDVVQARYEEIKKAKGWPFTRNLTFTGYDVIIREDQQVPTADRMLEKIARGFSLSREFTVATGSFGGYARCIGFIVGESETGSCAWADNGTVGFLLGANFRAAELAKFLPAFRAAVER